MELYVKLTDGNGERFEPVETKPSGRALKIMVDYDLIRKTHSNLTPENLITLIQLIWKDEP